MNKANMTKQWKIFLTAVMYFTRIDVRKMGLSDNVTHLPEKSHVGPSANEPPVHSVKLSNEFTNQPCLAKTLKTNDR